MVSQPERQLGIASPSLIRQTLDEGIRTIGQRHAEVYDTAVRERIAAELIAILTPLAESYTEIAYREL
jgi:hypothetical protein